MMRIDCPWCGPRDEVEFRWGGESATARPADAAAASDAEWGAYLNDRINPRRVHHERWLHAAGCRRWFQVARDTATHAVAEVRRLDRVELDEVGLDAAFVPPPLVL